LHSCSRSQPLSPHAVSLTSASKSATNLPRRQVPGQARGPYQSPWVWEPIRKTGAFPSLCNWPCLVWLPSPSPTSQMAHPESPARRPGHPSSSSLSSSKGY
jgi:hypothetical protein